MDFVTWTFVTLGPILLAESILGDEAEGKTEKERMKKKNGKQRRAHRKKRKVRWTDMAKCYLNLKGLEWHRLPGF